MDEHPILFNGRNVQAILEGRKTQTRRVIKNVPDNVFEIRWCGDNEYEMTHYYAGGRSQRGHVGFVKCPYGQPGDQLWVRETFTPYRKGIAVGMYSGVSNNGILYRADAPTLENTNLKWRPSIHMPRWASRITLEVVSVRVERLQEITVKDAIAEGSPWGEGAGANPRVQFSNTWDAINAKRGFGWGMNPWVWVVEFKVA